MLTRAAFLPCEFRRHRNRRVQRLDRPRLTKAAVETMGEGAAQYDKAQHDRCLRGNAGRMRRVMRPKSGWRGVQPPHRTAHVLAVRRRARHRASSANGAENCGAGEEARHPRHMGHRAGGKLRFSLGKLIPGAALRNPCKPTPTHAPSVKPVVERHHHRGRGSRVSRHACAVDSVCHAA